MRLFSNTTGMALFAASMCFSTAASASVIISGNEVGNDVVFSYEGSLDLAGFATSPNRNLNLTWIGNNGGSGVFYSLGSYTGFTGSVVVPSFDAALTQGGGVVSGDRFGFQPGAVFTNIGYVSGSAINGSLTFSNKSFADLGFSVGESFVTTTPNDTITLNIGNVSVVPLPAGLPLLLVGLGAFGLIARRKTA